MFLYIYAANSKVRRLTNLSTVVSQKYNTYSVYSSAVVEVAVYKISEVMNLELGVSTPKLEIPLILGGKFGSYINCQHFCLYLCRKI